MTKRAGLEIDEKPSGMVRRRHVFYIPGYDPIHPRRYRELYRKDSVIQAKISDYEIGVKGRPGKGRFGWSVESKIDQSETYSEFDVLVWADLVKDSMSASILDTYVLLARTAWNYISTGTLSRLMRLRKGPIIAALYPVGMLLAQLLVSLFAFLLMLRMGALFIGAPFGPWIGAIIGAAAFIGLMRFFKSLDHKLYAYYLMHDYSYSGILMGANPAELEARIGEFTAQIETALQSDVDEVLVVGHSSGAHIAISALSDLLRAKVGGKVGDEVGSKPGPALSFLSLGQVVPMVSFLPQADRLRADLQYLSEKEEIFWVDVTAPGDGCTFALCDPVAVSGVGTAKKKWPLVFSAAFSQTLSPERWKQLKWRFFRVHFQYLRAFDRPKDYDYFQITAGPLTLCERYKSRKPSASRIETPISKYVSVTP